MVIWKGACVKINSVMIEPKDNVAVAIEALSPGMQGVFVTRDGGCKNIEIIDNIPIYHKFAVTDIAGDAPVVKYGEHIGYAGADIKKGQHVHVHNVVSRRENLKK